MKSFTKYFCMGNAGIRQHRHKLLAPVSARNITFPHSPSYIYYIHNYVDYVWYYSYPAFPQYIKTITEKDKNEVINIVRSNNTEAIITIGNKSLEYVKDLRNYRIISILATNKELLDSENITAINLNNITPGDYINLAKRLMPEIKTIGVIYSPEGEKLLHSSPGINLISPREGK